MVGRIVPNKGSEDLLDAFAFYHHGYNSRSRLILVGSVDARLAAYRDELIEQAHALALEDAVFLAGSVSDAEELVQTACERVLNKSSQVRDVTRVDSWIYGIMRNLWIDELRSRRVRRRGAR